MAAVPQDPAGPDLHALEAIPSVPVLVVTPAVSILHPTLMVSDHRFIPASSS